MSANNCNNYLQSATLTLDGVTLNLCSRFLPSSFIVAEPDNSIQMATAVRWNKFQELSITAIPFGTSSPSEELPIARSGMEAQYRDSLRQFRIEQGGNPQAGPQIVLFGKSVMGSLSLINLNIDSVTKRPVLIVEWVTEAGERLWIVRASQELDEKNLTTKELSATDSLFNQFSLSSLNLARPSTLIIGLENQQKEQPTSELDSKAAIFASNLPAPNWWSGECDTNNYSKSPSNPKHIKAYPLGGSYQGVKACGPRPYYKEGPDVLVRFFAGAHGEYEWECVELSMRYLYLAYKIKPYKGNGKDVVWNYSGSRLIKIKNGTIKSAPQPGDVISYGPTTTYGHTAVVSASNVDSKGNGTITVIEQNAAAKGIKKHTVKNWSVQNSMTVSGWLHDPKPDAPTLSLPLNGSMSFSGAITFSWKAAARASEYYLEYSGPATGTTGWIKNTNANFVFNIPGNYTWRVKSRNAAGESPWSANWGFTIQPPAPTLELPANDASTNPNVSFAWNISNGATEYYLEYSGPSSGNSGWINATGFSANSLPVGTYTWQVKARNGSIESPWSQTRTFTVAPTLPPAPTLSSPSNGSEIEADVTFTWNTATDATEYYLEYTGPTSGNSDWVSDTSYSVLSLPVGTYQWKVKARNSTGESSWSDIWTITVKPTIVPPLAPTLISPADAENVSADLTFTWDTVAEATEYYAEYSGPFSGNSGWISTTNFSVTSLAVGTYDWQVKARNSAGESLWSVTRTFTVEPTIVSPAAPSLISPTDTSSVNPDFTFTWNRVTDATEYFVEYSGSAIGDSGWISATSFPVTSLPVGSYTWHVKARNSAGESSWSGTWAFDVEPIIVPPSAPALVNPAYTASVYPDFSFSWSSTADATEYYAEYAGASSGNSGWTSGTSFAVISLPVGNYTWQVKARNSAGEGPWSQTWSYSVVPYPPAAPTPVSPTNGATIVGSSATFTWNGVSGAVEYYAEYSGPSSGNSGWITGTTFSANSLSAGTYTWHVKARNAGGESPWSASWTVIIQSPPSPIIIQPTLTPAYGSTCTTAWYRVSGGYNSTYIYLTLNTNISANSTNSGKWKPTIPLTGKYKIEAFVATHNQITWPCSPGGTIGWDTSDAKYQVYTNGVKTSTVKINQAPLENAWATIGTFTLTAGTNNYVILTDLNGETQWTKTISFNVMKFTWVSP